MEYKTLFNIMVSVLLIQAIALMLTWRQNREEIGIRDWAYGGGCMAVGSLLTAMGLYAEGLHPAMSHLQRALGAGFAAAGWFLVWIGTRHFYGRPAASYLTVVLSMALFTILLALKPDTAWRVALVSTAIALFAALAGREFLRQDVLRRPAILLMLVMLAFTCVAWLLRALAHAQVLGHVVLIDAIALYNAIVASLTLTVSMIVLTNERINERLHDLASRDPLTGAMNRRAFFDTSAQMMGALHRGETELTLCLLDLDHFKQVNDRHGHAAGDQVLKQLARIAQEALREGDLFARYGGEEFVAVMRDSTRGQAEQAMQRLRKAIGGQPVEVDGMPLAITFSVGIAHAAGPSRVGLEDLLVAADQAMYQAKEEGRDRIVCYPETLGRVPKEGLRLVSSRP